MGSEKNSWSKKNFFLKIFFSFFLNPSPYSNLIKKPLPQTNHRYEDISTRRANEIFVPLKPDSRNNSTTVQSEYRVSSPQMGAYHPENFNSKSKSKSRTRSSDSSNANSEKSNHILSASVSEVSESKDVRKYTNEIEKTAQQYFNASDVQKEVQVMQVQKPSPSAPLNISNNTQITSLNLGSNTGTNTGTHTGTNSSPGTSGPSGPPLPPPKFSNATIRPVNLPSNAPSLKSSLNSTNMTLAGTFRSSGRTFRPASKISAVSNV